MDDTHLITPGQSPPGLIDSVGKMQDRRSVGVWTPHWAFGLVTVGGSRSLCHKGFPAAPKSLMFGYDSST